MSRIVWDATGERFVEAGVDRGVLFVGSDPGVPWNGLQSVSETFSGGAAEPFYMDGIKYLNVASDEEFSATIVALSAPKEFGPCDGTGEIAQGLFLTQQPRVPFNLCYRTKIGNDVEGLDHGYKIHLVYNALASPSARNRATISANPTPMNLSWGVTTTPDRIAGQKSTAHAILDSTKVDPYILAFIEDMLYGSSSNAPVLLSISQIVGIFDVFAYLEGVDLDYLGPLTPTIAEFRNLHPNPLWDATGATTSNIANTGTPLFQTVGGLPGARFTCTSASASRRMLHPANLRVAAITGDVIHFKVLLYNPNASDRILSVAIRSYSDVPTSGTLTELTSYSSANQVIAAGASYLFEGSITVTDATVQSVGISVSRSASGGAVSDLVDVGRVWFGKTASCGTHFSGDTADFVYGQQMVNPEWVGTVKQSPSKFDYKTELTAAADVGDAYNISGHLWVFKADVWTDRGISPIPV